MDRRLRTNYKAEKMEKGVTSKCEDGYCATDSFGPEDEAQ